MTDTAKLFLDEAMRRRDGDPAKAAADLAETCAGLMQAGSAGYRRDRPTRAPEWRGKPQHEPLGVETERPDPNPEGGR
jgi:hypothetical protein